MENILKSILLGTVQGVSEFLPISSSGHLIIFRSFMNLELPLIFDIYLHLATVFVVFIYYRKRIVELVLTLIKFISGRTSKLDSENLKLISMLLIITFVTGFIGVFIDKYENSFTLNLVLVNFVITGILLLILEMKLFKFNFQNNIFISGIFIGLMQGIGAMPGISRSGITIFAAVLLGFSKSKASEVSFLALIPVVFGGLLLKYKEFLLLNMTFSFFEVNVAAFFAFIVGFISINFLMKILRSKKLYYFSIYLFLLSGALYFFF